MHGAVCGASTTVGHDQLLLFLTLECNLHLPSPPLPLPLLLYATATAGVPTVWLNLLSHMDKHNLKLRHLQRVCIAGSAPPRSMIQALEK
jgi:acyl-CoA synthetase (AMP-forming)/AMP-acid ligase II